jgi:hypothetical protein
MTHQDHADTLLADALDFLSGIQTALHAATIAEQIAIEQAAQTIYGPNEGNHYNRLTSQIADLRDRIHHHLEN